MLFQGLLLFLVSQRGKFRGVFLFLREIGVVSTGFYYFEGNGCCF